MYQEKITKLLQCLNRLLNAYEKLDGELINVHGQTNDEWKAEALSLVSDCETFFSEMASIDKPFSHFCAKEFDKENTLHNSRLMEDVEDGFYSLMSPFDGYFDIVEQLSNSMKRVDWLRKKYRPITAAKARLEGEIGHFGNFRFILGPKGILQSVAYKEKSLDITGLRLKFFYVVMNKCYYNCKNDISFEEIENYIGGAGHDE